MNKIIRVEQVKKTLLSLRGQEVILASDVANLYGVETKVINQAVKNNPEKFPQGFVYELTKEEWTVLRSKILTLEPQSGRGHYPKYLPKVFTEKGLYMLATILKSPIATQTTLAIVNTFAEVRELKHQLLEIHDAGSHKEKEMGMKRIGNILADIVMPDMETTEIQSSLEFNFVIGKLKHSIIRQRKNDNSDLILREKVEFAKRLLSRGFKEDDIKELADLTEVDIEKLEKLNKNN